MTALQLTRIHELHERIERAVDALRAVAPIERASFMTAGPRSWRGEVELTAGSYVVTLRPDLEGRAAYTPHAYDDEDIAGAWQAKVSAASKPHMTVVGATLEQAVTLAHQLASEQLARL
jgi:hypothetical protein